MNNNNFLHWNVCNHDKYTPRKKQETNPKKKKKKKKKEKLVDRSRNSTFHVGKIYARVLCQRKGALGTRLPHLLLDPVLEANIQIFHTNFALLTKTHPNAKPYIRPMIQRHQKQSIDKYRKGRNERDSWNHERECGRISRLPDDQRQR